MFKDEEQGLPNEDEQAVGLRRGPRAICEPVSMHKIGFNKRRFCIKNVSSRS
jgi:hypothetical protein